MPLVPAVCTQCGASIEVDSSHEAGICKYCGTAFITEKVINQYTTNVINNNNFAGATINVTGIDIDSKIAAAKKLAKSGLISEAKEILFQLTKECPEDYQAWFLLAQYEYEFDDVWLDDSSYFVKARALADDDGLASINQYYTSIKSEIVAKSKTVIDFCDHIDFTKLYYCYVKWYYSDTYNDNSGFGYWGFEPVNGQPAVVSYTKNEKFCFVRQVLAQNCEIVSKIHQKRVIAIVKSADKCVWLPQYVKNEISVEWKNKSGVDRYDTSRMYITGFDGTKVIYNDTPYEMVYGDQFREKSTDFEKTNIGKTGCYIATCVYGSYDCPQVWVLRRFRDYTLGKIILGRLFIGCYYAISPLVVKIFGSQQWFRKFWMKHLDRLVIKLKEQGVKDTRYFDKQ